MTTKTIITLLIAALLAGPAIAYAKETPIQVAMEDGGALAQFKLGDFNCVLQNGQIRCAQASK